MACKDGGCPEEGDGDSDAPRFHRDPRPLFLFGDLVSVSVRGAETSKVDGFDLHLPFPAQNFFVFVFLF